MGRIFITGDTHQNIDIKKLTTANFQEQKSLNKGDYLIICGDFGMIWNNSREEMYWRKWLKEKNFTTLWVDGNHENFDLIDEYPTSEWNGGMVHFIEDSIIHLMRGKIYNINGYKFFTMGGGTSVDKEFRKEGVTWWKQEQPSSEEYNIALTNLDKNDWKVDYVITHTTSNKIMEEMNYIKENSQLNNFFDMLETNLSFKHWYFGHFHDSIEFEKHTLLFNKIVELK